MSSLITNLNDKLAPDDPRWLAFGLEMPATPRTPGQPQNVSVTLAADGAILVQCDPTPLATRYRCRTFIVGIDTRYQLAWSGVAIGVQPGVTLQITMQAVNGSSQSVASEPVGFTMPAGSVPKKAAATGTETLDELAPLTAITPPNGNGNGSHALSRIGQKPEPSAPKGKAAASPAMAGAGFAFGISADRPDHHILRREEARCAKSCANRVRFALDIICPAAAFRLCFTIAAGPRFYASIQRRIRSSQHSRRSPGRHQRKPKI